METRLRLHPTPTCPETRPYVDRAFIEGEEESVCIRPFCYERHPVVQPAPAPTAAPKGKQDSSGVRPRSVGSNQNVLRSLPSVAGDRKAVPITTGVIDYFPLALAEVARLSKQGNDQHNPGQPLHWARGKSTDHADCLLRHLIQRGELDTDGISHTAKVAWRALALLQEEMESLAGFDPNGSAVVSHG